MWSRRLSGPVVALVVLRASCAIACSPGFDNNVFPTTDAQLLSLPAADFDQELRRIEREVLTPLFGTMRPTPLTDDQAFEAELAELRAVLDETNTADPLRDDCIHRYKLTRYELRDWLGVTGWSRRRETDRRSCRGWPAKSRHRIYAHLPAEFNLYFRGALAYARRDVESARYWWNRLLELPPEQRRYRSVWAAYMIGRSYVFSTDPGHPELVIEWMARTRFLARQGFADCQGLAAASYGWQARGHLDLKHFDRAIELYFAMGDSPSLVITTHAALAEPPAVLDRLVRHELSAKVVTALVVSRGGPWGAYIHRTQAEDWLDALERADAKDVDGADRVAWAAYQNGDVAAARRWLGRARAAAPMARWLASKFLLRDGRVDEAANVLVELMDAWPVNEEWRRHREYPFQPAAQLAGDLGVLHMHRGRYIEAMDLMLRSGLFRDAAYVADRVLTIDELKGYVDANWPPSTATPFRAVPTEYGELKQWRGPPIDQIALRIRYLLARRLARLGRHPDAAPYFPNEVRPLLERYVAAVAGRDDPTLSPDERGQSLWRAALIAREHGMELIGTELEPDFFTQGGWYGAYDRDQRPLRLRNDDQITGASRDEYDRAVSTAPSPDKRFHYRYVAADHAWEAARLLPDESDLKAEILRTAGGWLAAQDAPAADRFYKALVRECGTTKLGRAARLRKWFP